MIYECIRKYATEYSLNWLLNKLNILRTAYYNYLKDRSIVASITDREITADLAIRTVKKQLKHKRIWIQVS